MSEFMNGNVIDGKAVAASIRKETAKGVEELKATTGGKVPGLAVIIVGERKDSQMYVRMKKKMCAEVGIASFGLDMPESSTEEEVIAAVRKFNEDPSVHGILVQLPLPKHINEEKVLLEISIEKDVDGFHPENIGMLAMKGRTPLFMPCTPHGCMVMLERIGFPIKGQNAVVIGRSNIVGMPAALMLIERDATVTVVHSRTKNPEKIVKEADIIIAAVGAAEMVKKSWVKKGAAIIDVGMNAIPDDTKKAGTRMVGDVAFDECAAVAGAITPVPGGVGPMTIAMLLKNTLEGFKHAQKGPQAAAGSANPVMQLVGDVQLSLKKEPLGAAAGAVVGMVSTVVLSLLLKTASKK